MNKMNLEDYNWSHVKVRGDNGVGIIFKDGKYLDQIDGETWVGRYKFRWYLSNKYGISEVQYYNLVMHNDINYQPKCNVCGILHDRFISLDEGYKKTCISRSCINSWSSKMRVLNGTHNFLGKNLTPELKQLHLDVLASFEFRCKATTDSMRPKLKDCPYYLYESDITDESLGEGYFHIGSTYDVNNRLADGKIYFDNLVPLYKGSGNDILDIEEEVKLKYADRDIFEKFRKTEVFRLNDRDDIHKFIEEYIANNKDSTTIEKLY